MFPPLRLREALKLGGLSPRELAVRTWRLMEKNEIQTRAAGVAFYAMLALVPFIGLILAITVQLLPDLTGGSKLASGVAVKTVRLKITRRRAEPERGGVDLGPPDPVPADAIDQN